jgi:hypothetical protein
MPDQPTGTRPVRSVGLRSPFHPAGRITRPFLIAMAAKHQLNLIDPIAYLSAQGRVPCLGDKAEPIYKDTHHLRASYVRDAIRYMDQTLDPLAPSVR